MRSVCLNYLTGLQRPPFIGEMLQESDRPFVAFEYPGQRHGEHRLLAFTALPLLKQTCRICPRTGIGGSILEDFRALRHDALDAFVYAVTLGPAEPFGDVRNDVYSKKRAARASSKGSTVYSPSLASLTAAHGSHSGGKT